MSSNQAESQLQSRTIGFFLVALVCAFIAFWGGLENLVERWIQREEYSHGFFIPLLSLWLLWHRRDALKSSIGAASFWGLPLILTATVLLIVGELSAIFILIQFGFILVLAGLVLLLGGVSLLRVCALPIVFLGFAIPMPYFIDAQLSWGLQLISSSLGVDMLRLVGVSVFLEGNLIDLGEYKLQVVEACSGLRYLYPLTSLGFLAAYLFSAPMWMRVLVFVSTVPITIFMNSFRIAVIGVLVNQWGTDMAEGFLHFFEGWVIFMGCAVLLLLEIWLLDRLVSRRPLGDLLLLPQVAAVAPSGVRSGGVAYLGVAIGLLIFGGYLVFAVGDRDELIPERARFTSFPLEFEDWRGREDYLTPDIEEALGVEDYFLADYHRNSNPSVNLYMAYYASQRKGNSPHSPRVCLPGGGWQITEFEELEYSPVASPRFPINRAELTHNDDKLLVYYWFEQRGRRMANEYRVKWYLLLDALFMNRTDGALMRVSTHVRDNESMAEADERLKSFIDESLPDVPRYIPH